MNYIPTVIEVTHEGERHYDVYSLLLKERIIMLQGEINDTISSNIIAQLLYLYSNDPNKDIYLYINNSYSIIKRQTSPTEKGGENETGAS